MARDTPAASRAAPLVVATDRLPAIWSDTAPADTALDDALDAGLRPLITERDGAWVGWPGSPSPPPLDGPGAAAGPVRLPLTDSEIDEHLRGHSDSTLWPIYHDALDRPVFHHRWRSAYRKVNGRYARTIAETAAPATAVWIHGHRLQLVPGMLRRLRPDLRIGFFMHSPFPPAELFTRLPTRTEVLDGLLGADVIGLQRPGGADNLLRLCREVLDLPAGHDETRLPGRTVRIRPFPAGVDADQITRLAAAPSARRRAAEIRAQLGHPGTVVLGIDKLDTSQGTEHRLAAFSDLVAAGRLDGDDTVLIQVVLPDPHPTAARRALRDRVEHRVGRINGDHARVGGPVVHYLHQHHSLAERVALYLAADVMTVTALREGTSLVAQEYLAARVAAPGALLLSEMSGAADDLPDAFLVNPHDTDALRTTMLAAARCPPDHRAARGHQMIRSVRHRDVHDWVSDFLAHLDAPVRSLLEAHT